MEYKATSNKVELSVLHTCCEAHTTDQVSDFSTQCRAPVEIGRTASHGDCRKSIGFGKFSLCRLGASALLIHRTTLSKERNVTVLKASSDYLGSVLSGSYFISTICQNLSGPPPGLLKCALACRPTRNFPHLFLIVATADDVQLVYFCRILQTIVHAYL
ncbi:hypothetical protein EV424DRAFT_1426986 [Suillus variegatus]|nr:hypothetical protein EV424DRAFT_1426986 [Suillus variegatus]